MEVVSEVRDVIARHLSVSPQEIAPESLLVELGMQSVDLITVIYTLERRFDVSLVLRADEIPAWETCDVRWVADFVVDRMSAVSAPA